MLFIVKRFSEAFRTYFGVFAALTFAQVIDFIIYKAGANWTTLQPEFRGADQFPDFKKRLWDIYKLIPFPLVKEPEQILEIEYVYSDYIEVGIGRYLFPLDLRYQPTRVAWPKQYVRSFYTLILTDLDYPSEKNNTEAEYLNWMIGNIEGPPEKRLNDTIAQYIGPYPEEGTGVHRYMFFLFRQPKRIEYHYEPKLNTLRNDTRRRKFSTRRFARKYNLGEPAAATFFLAQFWHHNNTVEGFP